MSYYTLTGLMLLSASVITLFVAEGNTYLYAFASILSFLSGFSIGGGVGKKEGMKQANQTK